MYWPRLLTLTWLGVCFLGVPAVASEKPPRYPLVAVASFRIEPQPYPGAPLRTGESELLERLVGEATARAERTLVKQHIAGRVERLAGLESATAAPVLTGVVRLPLSLPPGQGGARAMFRKGPFASASVLLRQPDGTSIQREVTLDWRDIRWTRGARIRRVRRFDDVLVDFVRKGVDHAVKRIQRSGPSEVAATGGALTFVRSQ